MLANYTHRSDLLLDLSAPISVAPANIYTQAFDGISGDEILFFTADPLALHPLSFLLPPEPFTWVNSATEIYISKKSMQLGNFNLKRDELIPNTDFSFLAKPSRELIAANLEVLRNTLKVFGVKSIVWQLVFDNLDNNPFYGNRHALFAGISLLEQSHRYLGMGEGLTPAFDDYLSGFLFIDRVLGLNRLKLEDNFFEIAINKTTRQSVQQLRFANIGKLSMRFESFLFDFLSAELRATKVLPLLSYGHSSGTDILCGILLGFEEVFLCRRE